MAQRSARGTGRPWPPPWARRRALLAGLAFASLLLLVRWGALWVRPTPHRAPTPGHVEGGGGARCRVTPRAPTPAAYALDGPSPPSLDGRLSPVDIKRLAEVVYGDEPWPPGMFYRPLTLDLVPCLQPGVVVFVETRALASFATDILPHITAPFVLVSGDSDASAPRAYLAILADPHVMHWYGMNCDMDAHDPALQGRFTCLPLGNSQWNGHREALQRVVESAPDLVQQQREGRLRPRPRLLLSSFDARSNPNVREPLAAQLANASFAVSGYQGNRTKEEFYRLMLDFQFVVSPHGMGLDCYRTWEALYLGCIPIVTNSTLDSSYDGLPVLILRNWAELTEERLRDAWANLSVRTFDYSPLFLGHWQRRFYGSRAQGDHVQTVQYDVYAPHSSAPMPLKEGRPYPPDPEEHRRWWWWPFGSG